MNQNHELKKRAQIIRKKIVESIVRSKTASHIGSALSSVDILAALYFDALNNDPKNPNDPNRDRFILSKGHAAIVLYATLHERGFFGDDILQGFYQNGGALAGHPSFQAAPVIEATTGSLGHGLSIGLGMALAAKYDEKKYRTFVLLSDGECDEGSIWEAILAAGHMKVDNLIAVVDYNKIQSFGTVKEVMDLEPLDKKFESFGWAVRQVDGHDIGALQKLLHAVPFEKGKPSVLLAHTVKGKGVSYMEHKLEWHYKTPNKQQAEDALKEIESL